MNFFYPRCAQGFCLKTAKSRSDPSCPKRCASWLPLLSSYGDALISAAKRVATSAEFPSWKESCSVGRVRLTLARQIGDPSSFRCVAVRHDRRDVVLGDLPEIAHGRRPTTANCQRVIGQRQIIGRIRINLSERLDERSIRRIVLRIGAPDWNKTCGKGRSKYDQCCLHRAVLCGYARLVSWPQVYRRAGSLHHTRQTKQPATTVRLGGRGSD